MVRRLALLFLAACNTSNVPSDVRAINPWSLGPDLPGPRLEPGVTALGQRLVVVGGFSGNVTAGLPITSDVIALDPVTQTWSPLHPAPVAWTHINLAAAGTTLYLLGGEETAQFIPRGETFALDTGVPGAEWRPLAPLPAGQERGAAGIVVSPPHIYLIGGAGATEALATVLDYDLSTNTWATLPPLPAPRSHPAAMRRNDGMLIVAGGLATLDAQSATDDVFGLPLLGTEWQTRGKMLDPRGGCAYGVALGQLVCAGGEVGQAALSTVESYDPIGNVWTVRTPMPEPRAGTQGAAIGDRLFVPGGSASLAFQPTSSLFVYSLTNDPQGSQ